MTALILQGLCKQFELPSQVIQAVQGIDLRIKAGSFVTILGKSGCGKTTLLRLIGGLEQPTSGQILFQPSGVKVGFVFQEPRLLPWLTVEENLKAVIQDVQEAAEKEARVTAQLELLGLSRFRKAYPAQLSGGMAQRVALGRALCYEAPIILMDEPLGALDAFTRRSLQHELVKVFNTYHKTILFVTHDVDEALILGQRILVMDQGRVIQDFPVPLPYPRAIRDEAFYQLREKIFDSIMRC